MNITIRRATVADAHILGEAEREIAKEPGFFCSLPSELTDTNVANTINTFLKDDSGLYLVAECEGHIVGHAFLQQLRLQSMRHIATLNIAIHIGWQQKGIGRMLIERLIEWAKNTEAIEKIQLHVRSTNSVAISLYKKMGFQEEGRLKNRVKLKDRYIDDIIMGLDLNRYQEHKDIIIRRIEENDVSKMSEIFCFPWSTKEATEEKWNQYFAEHKLGTRTVCLAEKQGHLIGYASLQRKPDYADFKMKDIPEIHDVWVSKEWRHQGVGKMLVQRIEEIALSYGYKKIGLGVGLYEDYGPAQRLYYRLSYFPDGNGITYKTSKVTPGNEYPVDDDLVLWLTKLL
jgi:ribosomal protein S18 acetylase RimI-like enzyme